MTVDDFSSGRESNLVSAQDSGLSLHRASVTDREEMLSISGDFGPDVIFHLAAQIDVRRSVSDPAFDSLVNIGGTLNMLEAARSSGAERFVFASTGGAIYGEGKGLSLPLTEAAPANPLAPYGQSKLAAEGYLSLYQRLYGLDWVSLRFGNVYGPRQDPFGEAGVVAIFCSKLGRGESPLIYGTGEQTRDYVYVGDVVEAMLLASTSRSFGAFNIGTGVETSVLDLFNTLAAGADAEGLRPEMASPREGEVEQISIDPSLATDELGWKAQTTLEEGLRVTLESILETSG